MKVFVSIAAVWLVSWCGGAAKDYNVLLIGNSYTAQTYASVQAFFDADPDHSITITRVTPGGRQLHQHAAETSTTNLISNGGPWDLVVLQEQSQIPAFAALSSSWWTTFYTNGAQLLSQLAQAAGAKVLFFQTWARAAGDTDTLQFFNNDPIVMQDALTQSYGQAAANLGAYVIPVGEAWEDSLFSSPGLALHSGDRSHPNSAGSFLTGAVFFQTITGKDVRDSSYTGGLSANQATYLKTIAHYVGYWEWIQGFPGLGNTNITGDADGDGATNEEEWTADTNPGVGSDVLKATAIENGTDVVVNFPSSENCVYQVQSRTLGGSWGTVFTADGTGQPIFVNFSPTGMIWYHVLVSRKPM